MTVTVTVHEAKTILSELLARVGAGEEVLITEVGKPVARLVPAVEQPAPRVPGTAIGKLKIAPDFNQPSAEEIYSLFEQSVL